MVALPPVPFVLKVQFKGVYVNARWLNGFYLQYTGAAPNETQLLTLGGILDNTWNSTWASHISTDVKLQEVTVVDLASNDGAGATAATTQAGGLGLGGLPANVAICVSFKQTRRYRGGHPRVYVPGPQTGQLNDNQHFNGATCLLWKADFNAFRTAVQTAGYWSTSALVMVAVSRFSGHTFDALHNKVPTPLVNPIVRPVIDFAVDSRVDTQRRRLGT